ncbi:O-antigen ligase family protein [Agrobacterium sp.]|uniref:O-antigen ligase family protein n=1 Tax=Agrobacterium sp. TaxID=361 RepID=UPI0028AD0C2B|nr:O-antigen ligase family protein [Agrobacterium sp.]
MKPLSMNANNHVFIFAVAALAGIGGSVTTILLGASIVWAIISLSLKRFPPAFAAHDRFLIVPAVIYVLVQLVAMLINSDTGLTLVLRKLVPLLPFLLFWLMLPRLRISSGRSLFESFALGAAFCGILALPLAMWQGLVQHVRAEGGAGNALPFALICALFSVFSLLNLLSDIKWRKIVGFIGFVAGFVCLLLSQSRGMLPATVFAIVLFGVFFPATIKPWLNIKGALVLAVVAVIVVWFGISSADRISDTIAYMTSENTTATDNSYSMRMDLWKHGYELIQQNPIFGHGIQNRRTLVEQIGLNFSHFHNGFITALVDSGIVGFLSLVALLCAPLLAAVNAARDAFYRQRLFVAIVLTSTYIVGGLTNFIFGHDIYDSIFLWTALVIFISLPGSAEEKSEGSVRGTV